MAMTHKAYFQRICSHPPLQRIGVFDLRRGVSEQCGHCGKMLKKPQKAQGQ